MEFLKLLFKMVTSFFQSKAANTKKEVSLADAKEQAVVESIRASENAQAVQQHAKTQKALDEVNEQHKKEREAAKQKSIDEQLDDRFGSDE